MKGNEYVKFMTEEIVSYLHMPADEKRKKKIERKEKIDSPVSHWFGVIPFSLRLLIQQKRNSNK